MAVSEFLNAWADTVFEDWRSDLSLEAIQVCTNYTVYMKQQSLMLPRTSSPSLLRPQLHLDQNTGSLAYRPRPYQFQERRIRRRLANGMRSLRKAGHNKEQSEHVNVKFECPSDCAMRARGHFLRHHSYRDMFCVFGVRELAHHTTPHHSRRQSLPPHEHLTAHLA
jgi:hypothetical protein